jgi:phenylpropionate dioxygenase-like ring-hydroxylating dioxygenase large terminal subunit
MHNQAIERLPYPWLAPGAPAAPLRDQLPLAWYPILRASDLAKGESRAIEFLGKPWVAYRDEKGNLGLIGRYCSHMGADLSRGRVCEGRLECGLHGWRFDARGNCASLPAGETRERARLASARIAECAGIVFAHPGSEPSFGLAGILAGANEFSSTSEMEVPFHWLLAAVNTFDAAHYENIHHRRLLRAPELAREAPMHLGIRYAARVIRRRWFDWVLSALGASQAEIEIDCWGASLLVMRNLGTGFGLVISVAPVSDDRARAYVTAFRRLGSGERMPQPARRMALEIARRFGLSFLAADIPYLEGMRPHPGVLMPGKDDVAMAFWDYFRGLPKAGPA